MAIRLSIIVPTPDGDGLSRLFESMTPQLLPGDEVIIVGDIHDASLLHVEQLCHQHGARYTAHDAGHHCWGHCQINYGMTLTTGDYLVFNDDDDVFTPEAFSIIRARAELLEAPRPMLFRFCCERLGRTLPERYEVVESAIGGHCIVAPNDPDRLGRWGERYGGDFDFIESTLARYPEGPAWFDDVIAVAR